MLLFVFFAGCEYLPFNGNPVLARVNLRVLRLSEVDDVLGVGASRAEKEQYVGNWINREIWYRHAKKHVRSNQTIRGHLREYRRELIIKEYCDQYIRQHIMITENDVLKYYSDHQNEFIISVDAVFVEMYTSNNKNAATDVLNTLKKAQRPALPPAVELVKKGEYVGPLDKLLFAKNTSAFIGPVLVREKYYVVSVIGRYPENSLVRVEHVRGEIIQRLQIEAYLNASQQTQKELKEYFNVKIFEIPD